MKACLLLATAVAAGFCGGSEELPAPGEPKRNIVALNQDCTEMQLYVVAGKENAEAVRNYFFNVSKGGLTHFLINPNAHNTSYPSKVWDPVWHHDPRLQDVKLKQFDNSRILYENGVDWVKVMVDCCREQGVSPWLSMRMNDLHSIGKPYNWSVSKFWLDHPELRRKAGKLQGSEFDSELAFDFTHREVRDHALALVREMLENWDVDGIEFDWLRFPHHVNAAAERDRSGCASLTEFMREAKKIVDEIGRKRGKRLLVCVRVAAMPEAALGLGTDAAAWAREGLVDWVAPCNFFSTVDFALPFGEWKRLLAEANPKVRLVGGLDFAGVARDSWSPQGLTEAEFCGYVERMLSAGVCGLETFNLFFYHESPVSRFIQIEGMPDAERWVRSRERAYPVTFHDATPADYPSGQCLPSKLENLLEMTISVGRVGASSSVSVLLAFEGPAPEGLKDAIRLNGVPPTAIAEVELAKRLPRAARAKKAYMAEFPLLAAKDGDNCVRIDALKDSPRLFTCELLLGAEK